jgi:hypothetical protein
VLKRHSQEPDPELLLHGYHVLRNANVLKYRTRGGGAGSSQHLARHVTRENAMVSPFTFTHKCSVPMLAPFTFTHKCSVPMLASFTFTHKCNAPHVPCSPGPGNGLLTIRICPGAKSLGPAASVCNRPLPGWSSRPKYLPGQPRQNRMSRLIGEEKKIASLFFYILWEIPISRSDSRPDDKTIY